ncbi:GNAT family N-acetyltransferase [Cellulomonas triticagri]|uniref:N-acetyltransferase n=1 Tax=Cellulomonas triticagri TaxID=2483352 RepID=A0A3M2JMK0_9CELL|nr:GNAT family N-acetyltransferase [Cellulomonas triticagri]RMI14404.1 N-acetyltransferase [Cellulomonas triticagri]
MVVVTAAAPVHVEEAVRVLAATFRGDAVMGAVVGGPVTDRERRLAHVFRVIVRTGLRRGAVDLARAPGDPTVLGVAVWDAPGRTRTSILDLLRDLGSYRRAFGLRGLREALRLQRALDAAHPREPHWFLAAIGVHETGRGQGVGSALIASRLRAVDAAHPAMPAYLEASTDRSAALYARHGFQPTGRVGGFPTTSPISMWRGGAHDRVLATHA